MVNTGNIVNEKKENHFSLQRTCLDLSAINEQGRMEKSPSEINVLHGRVASIDQDDRIIGLQPAWSVGIGSSLVPEHALAYVRSNRWPGFAQISIKNLKINFLVCLRCVDNC